MPNIIEKVLVNLEEQHIKKKKDKHLKDYYSSETFFITNIKTRAKLYQARHQEVGNRSHYWTTNERKFKILQQKRNVVKIKRKKRLLLTIFKIRHIKVVD